MSFFYSVSISLYEKNIKIHCILNISSMKNDPKRVDLKQKATHKKNRQRKKEQMLSSNRSLRSCHKLCHTIYTKSE